MASPGDVFQHYRVDAAAPHHAALTSEAFLATDTDAQNEGPVLLEILRDGASGVEKARFNTRARRLQTVTHPSLLAVREIAPAYCALEAPGSRSLDGQAGLAIARTRQKLFWLAQIAGTLVALHKAGIVHGALTLTSVSLASDVLTKVSVPVGGDVSGSPLDDVHAFAAMACELVLGADVPHKSESTLTERLDEAGVPHETSILLARLRTGGSMTSADVAERLAPFSEFVGPMTERLVQAAAPVTSPMTERLVPVAPRRE